MNDLYGQRINLIQLLISNEEHEYQILSYLLYDMLGNDNGNINDTQEQILLYDSLPWSIKESFRNAMQVTVDYTNNLSNIDKNKIPLEQQICLMKVKDSVKEKAINKLKEIKSKSDDNGNKAKQYLDGLLKIPFGVYKQEPILELLTNTTNEFNEIVKHTHNKINFISDITFKNEYNSFETIKYYKKYSKQYIDYIFKFKLTKLREYLNNLRKNYLLSVIEVLNDVIKNFNIDYNKIIHSGKKKKFIIDSCLEFINYVFNLNNIKLINVICTNLDLYTKYNIYSTKIFYDKITKIENNINEVQNYIKDVNKILDNSIYGHYDAKRQINRVIGQWISGDCNGYCFGFEGSPGIGKTTLAKKGIANCLKDSNGISRPFHFIAIGGASTSSTLDGHNYTYVASTWGRIVDILMESKCMNPIIFIDELDKVSKTENGKEIIGILTHMIDSTQNDSFQDKYFAGIDIDLSKALFIFSYNDVENIDRILLDRIHRIKFDNLTLNDKITITKKHLLPEIYKNMGIGDCVFISDEVIEFIILTYTNEPGVRKLKDILFEIIGEINLNILTNSDSFDETIYISKDDIKYKYLIKKNEIKHTSIHLVSKVGLINGLWASSLGIGGIISIEASVFPSNSFLDLKLTGMQGDVMKESMNVAKTLAWSLLSNNEKKLVLKRIHCDFKYNVKDIGLHIHCPEGATPKDGPSAGCAITMAIYSILINKKIKKDIAVTGEISLQGNVTSIGGLNLKILGGIRAGVKTFLYPRDNDKDFKEFFDKNKNNISLNNVSFISVSNIYDVISNVFDEE